MRLPLVALCALLLQGACRPGAGCARPRPHAPDDRTVVDGLGRQVRLPRAITRVVSLAPSSTEILFALGAGPLVVGVDRYSDYPPAARSVAHVGAEVDPSLERIVALRPDVVFTATSANAQDTVETLERLGLPVYVSRAESLETILADLRGIGGALGLEADATRLTAEMRARLEAVRQRSAGRRPARVLVVVWPEPLVVAGRSSHVADLVRAAGGENVADDSSQPFPTYSTERVLEHAPEVVFVGTHSDGPAPSLAPILRLASLPAVRDHRVFTVDGNLLFRPGPRVVDGVEALAARIRGDAP